MPGLPQGKLLGSEEVQANISTRFEQACLELKAKGERQRAEEAVKNEETHREAILEERKKPQKDRLDFQKSAGPSYGVNSSKLKLDEEERDTLLDNDLELDKLREQRLFKLKARNSEYVANLKQGHGEYSEVFEEDFLRTVLNSKFCVAHFSHNDFETCKIMDKHLEELARNHVETRIFRINAEKAPFFVAKLGVKTLPSLVLFEDGKAIGCQVGFVGLSSGIDGSTRELEKRLGLAGVIRMEREFYDKPLEYHQKSKPMKSILAQIDDFDDPFE